MKTINCPSFNELRSSIQGMRPNRAKSLCLAAAQAEILDEARHGLHNITTCKHAGNMASRICVEQLP